MENHDEDQLFEAGQFGDHDPMALLRTLWYFFTLHFGLRGRDEHRKLCFGDIALFTDSEDGSEYTQYLFEHGTKTRTGEVGSSTRAFAPKMWATNTNQCPVQFYKCYLSKRPVAATDPDSPFYLAVNRNRSAGDPWYKNAPLGKTKLGGFMTTAAKAVGMHQKRLTNHCARKTQIQRLVDNEFAPTVVAQLSGHKNLKSLDSYMTASKKQQKAMSDSQS